MKTMFIINDLGINEPFGPMILSEILKQKGHKTTLGVIKKEDVMKKIFSYKPDILAYSMMSVDMKDMKKFNSCLTYRDVYQSEEEPVFKILVLQSNG